MNKQRRQQIGEIRSKLEDLSWDLGNLLDEEQDYYDNMPESLQGGEKDDTAQSAIDALERARDGLTEAINALEEAAA
jgi:flagellar biosynthesis chaperone FliJ